MLSGFYEAGVLLQLDTMIHEATHAVADTSDYGYTSSSEAREGAIAKPEQAPTCAYNLAGLAVQRMHERVKK